MKPHDADTQQPGRLYGGSTIAALHRSAFKAFASREALVGAGVRLTYRELEAHCHQTVRYLQSIGLRRQDGIAILTGNRAEAVVVNIAAQMLGLRLSALHPLASAEDQAFVLQDADIKALVIDAARHAERGAALAKLGIARHLLTLGPSGLGSDLVAATAELDASDFPLEVQPDDIAKISYTGGTTGRSKGVVQRQRTAVTMTLQQLSCWEWPAETRFLAATPISHAAGACLLPTFLRGGTVFFMDKYQPDRFLQEIEAHRITCTFLVPSQIYGLLDCAALARADLSSLRRVWYGAAPMAPARLAESLEKIGPVFGQVYGQAEAPMTISYLRADEHDPRRPQLMGSCGRPLPGNDVRLLDADLREVERGEIGEVCVRGPLVMSGYLNRPEETAKVFAGDWLHTGDLARMDADGYLYLVDRAKDMIISGGFNVYSAEVENCLALHPAVASCAVIGVPDSKWGEAVTALVVLRQGSRASERELIDFVAERKGAVCAPKAVSFERELPLTSLGKVDKKTLRARYWGRDKQIG
jgi:fatty-acyl-CoA synthase